MYCRLITPPAPSYLKRGELICSLLERRAEFIPSYLKREEFTRYGPIGDRTVHNLKDNHL
jgi:hypothetical protein